MTRHPSPAVDVVVPIHNAAADVERCVASVLRETRGPFRLILINDGSTDPDVAPLLARLRDASPHILVVDRPDNRGFVRTANEGFDASTDADVVLLNSDTIVSRNWLGKLIDAARSRPDVATVTPLTNNGTLCSVPNAFEANQIPDGYDVGSFADLVEAESLRLFPEAPTGVGFCLFVTRRALTAVGPFDAGTFGPGYGEENDFCQRAIRAGLVNLIADDTFVYHKGRASFGDRSNGLIARHLASVGRAHPGYAAEIARYAAHHPLTAFHARLRDAIAARASDGGIRLRVLHILHHGGGTEKHARDLAALDDPAVLSYVLLSDGRHLDVDEFHAGRRRRTLRFPLPAAIARYGPMHDAGYRDALVTLCSALAVDLVHVHHLMHHTLDIADVAAAFGIPYVLTLHDYYTVCPRYTLLDPEGRPCGACTGASGPPADACMHDAGQPASYLDGYQALMRRFIAGAARVFVPNVRVREIVGARYPELMRRAEVIEHGHRFGTAAPPRQRIGRAPVNVAVIGGLEIHKGSAVFRDLLRANRNAETTFHLYGTTADRDIAEGVRDRVRLVEGSRLVYHGPYDAGDIVRRLIADGIDIGLHPAIWPEAFSYTLSEFVEAGIPVIAGALGAQGERIDRCRLGWTVPDIRDPQATLAILDAVVRNPAALAAAARDMRRDEALIPLDRVWREYAAIYRGLTGSRRRFMPPHEERAASAINPAYVATLATALSGAVRREEDAQRQLVERDAALAEARLRLRSPRHRLADAAAHAIQKMPVVWPLLAKATDAVLGWERRRGGR